MRLPGWRVLAVLGGVGAVVAAPCAQVRADGFQVSFAAGSRDAAGRFAGGTEMRLLTAHAGRLYAENPMGLHLRSMNIIYETTKERGTTILLPTAMVDSMTAALPLALAAQGTTQPSTPAPTGSVPPAGTR